MGNHRGGKRLSFAFELSEDEFRLLNMMAQMDDRPKASWLRTAIRSEAAKRGIRPGEVRAVPAKPERM